MIEVLNRLTTSCLADLARSLRQASGIGGRVIEQIVGTEEAEGVLAVLSDLEKTGWRTDQIATLFETAHEIRTSAVQPERLMDLVISGPEVNGVPTRDTLAVMQSLIADAKREVILVGYAIHNGRTLFAPLARKMVENPSLDVWFCLNVFHEASHSTSNADSVDRFMSRFFEENWPWNVKPRVYYDTRWLENESTQSSLHAKCLICDREKALISSANFTEAAQKRNIEAGVLVSHTPTVERLAGYFDGLKQAGVLKAAKHSKGDQDGGIRV